MNKTSLTNTLILPGSDPHTHYHRGPRPATTEETVRNEIKIKRNELHKKHPQLEELWREYQVMKVLLEGPNE